MFLANFSSKQVYLYYWFRSEQICYCLKKFGFINDVDKLIDCRAGILKADVSSVSLSSEATFVG